MDKSPQHSTPPAKADGCAWSRALLAATDRHRPATADRVTEPETRPLFNTPSQMGTEGLLNELGARRAPAAQTTPAVPTYG